MIDQWISITILTIFILGGATTCLVKYDFHTRRTGRENDRLRKKNKLKEDSEFLLRHIIAMSVKF